MIFRKHCVCSRSERDATRPEFLFRTTVAIKSSHKVPARGEPKRSTADSLSPTLPSTFDFAPTQSLWSRFDNTRVADFLSRTVPPRQSLVTDFPNRPHSRSLTGCCSRWPSCCRSTSPFAVFTSTGCGCETSCSEIERKVPDQPRLERFLKRNNRRSPSTTRRGQRSRRGTRQLAPHHLGIRLKVRLKNYQLNLSVIHPVHSRRTSTTPHFPSCLRSSVSIRMVTTANPHLAQSSCEIFADWNKRSEVPAVRTIETSLCLFQPADLFIPSALRRSFRRPF